MLCQFKTKILTEKLKFDSSFTTKFNAVQGPYKILTLQFKFIQLYFVTKSRKSGNPIEYNRYKVGLTLLYEKQTS
jgi:hypothetical protein